MNEADFHRVADSTLTVFLDGLEEADSVGVLDIECQSGVLTVVLPQGRTLVVSKHTPSKQIWYSSPVLGGLHFPFDEQAQKWILTDGRELSQVFSSEVFAMSSVEVRF